MSTAPYRPAWFVPGAHLRTLWGRLVRPGADVPTRVERWDTPDGDRLSILRSEGNERAPRIVCLHGLEGSVRSHYVRLLFSEAARRGWGCDMMLFRTCDGETNRARRSYHSGETEDASMFIERVASENPDRPLLAVGYSLGGNVLLKLLGERGAELPAALRGAAAISVPYDLHRGCRRIGQGFSRVYQAYFLRSLKRKAAAKLAAQPDLAEVVSADAVAAARTLEEFDDTFTAPVHGFESAIDYYARSSALRFLHGVRLPTLLLSAEDDPFLPRVVLDEVRAAARENPALSVEFVAKGGHVGFISGSDPRRPLYYAEWRAAEFFAELLRTNTSRVHSSTTTSR